MGGRRRSWRVVLAVALALTMAGCADVPARRGGGIRTTDVAVGFINRAAGLEGQAGQTFLSTLTGTSGGTLRAREEARPGAGVLAVLEEVRRGDLQIAWLATDALEAAGVGRLASLQAPFLLATPAAQRAVTDPVVARAHLATVEEPGVVGLALWGGPLRRPIASGRPLLAPRTWAGRKVRSLSPTQSATFAAFGATPIEVEGDLNQLVPVGSVDAAETDLPRQVVAADYTIAPYITGDVVLWSRLSVVVANRRWFDSLSDKQVSWVESAAETARLVSVEPGTREVEDVRTALELCRSGARFPQAGPRAVAELHAAAAPVIAGLRGDPRDGPLLASLERALRGVDTRPEPLDLPQWCAGDVSPLQAVTRVPHTRPPIPPGTYRMHLTSEDIASAGVGKVRDAQVVTLLIAADGTYTNTSRFDDDGSVMVFEAGEVYGDAETVYFVNDLERLRAIAERGDSACVWTDPGLGCITNVAPYSVRWELLDDGSLRLSDPSGVNPDPVLVLTITAKPYRRVA